GPQVAARLPILPPEPATQAIPGGPSLPQAHQPMALTPRNQRPAKLYARTRRSARPASVDSLRSRPCITGCYVALPRCRSGEQCYHCGRPVDSGSDVLGGQWQCGVEVLRTDRYRVAYPIVVPPRSLTVKPSSACLSATSMSS